MSRVMSFRDLRLIPELARYNEIELLHPSKDALVNKYLEQLGFNTDAPVEYIPNKHRDIRGVVAVGFRAVGVIAVGSAFLNSRMASMEDRIMAAYFTDPSLAREMSMMMNTGIRFADTPDGDDDGVEFPPELEEEDYEDVAAHLKALEELRDRLRGPTHNEAGAAKTPAEYKAYHAA